MPAESALTPLGREMLARLPAFLRRDPDVMGVIHPQARELERLEERLRLIQRNLFAALAEEMLPLWQAIVGTTSDPPGQSIAQQQETVKAFLQTLLTSATGLHWRKLLTTALGTGYTYKVHHDEPIIDPLTVVVVIPWEEGSSLHGAALLFARRVTQAHVELTVTEGEGFVLDQSLLDDTVL